MKIGFVRQLQKEAAKNYGGKFAQLRRAQPRRVTLQDAWNGQWTLPYARRNEPWRTAWQSECIEARSLFKLG